MHSDAVVSVMKLRRRLRFWWINRGMPEGLRWVPIEDYTQRGNGEFGTWTSVRWVETKPMTAWQIVKYHCWQRPLWWLQTRLGLD